jgi:possible tyrosine transporter P-protein (TC 2.A.45.2.1)
MTGAALLLLLANFGHDAEHQSKHVLEAFNEVEWITIFFFVGLFIVVHGWTAPACSSCWPTRCWR